MSEQAAVRAHCDPPPRPPPRWATIGVAPTSRSCPASACRADRPKQPAGGDVERDHARRLGYRCRRRRGLHPSTDTDDHTPPARARTPIRYRRSTSRGPLARVEAGDPAGLQRPSRPYCEPDSDEHGLAKRSRADEPDRGLLPGGPPLPNAAAARRSRENARTRATRAFPSDHQGHPATAGRSRGRLPTPCCGPNPAPPTQGPKRGDGPASLCQRSRSALRRNRCVPLISRRRPPGSTPAPGWLGLGPRSRVGRRAGWPFARRRSPRNIGPVEARRREWARWFHCCMQAPMTIAARAAAGGFQPGSEYACCGVGRSSPAPEPAVKQGEGPRRPTSSHGQGWRPSRPARSGWRTIVAVDGGWRMASPTPIDFDDHDVGPSPKAMKTAPHDGRPAPG